MIYCIEAWGNASICHFDKLFIIPKKVIRLVSFTNYEISSVVTFLNLEILPLVYSRIGIMMYKYSENLLTSAINHLYVIMMFTNILQDKNICFLFIRVALMSMQIASETKVFLYGMLYSPKFM